MPKFLYVINEWPLTVVHSLKVLDRYDRYLRVLSTVKGKSLLTHPRGREWAMSLTINVGVDRMNPSTKFRVISEGDERVEVRETSYFSGFCCLTDSGPTI